MDVKAGETVPAALVLGNIPVDRDTRSANLRVRVGGAQRKPWQELFFDGDFTVPLQKMAGINATAWSGVLELAARAHDLKGAWKIANPGPLPGQEQREYVATFI